MTQRRLTSDILNYSRSARSDVRSWGMFLIGAAFMFAAVTIDPSSNCSEDGECAPWLVPIAFVLGAAVGLGGLGQLLANPNRGSKIDEATGTLLWWQNRIGASGGDEGRIHPKDIGRIRIVKVSDGTDNVQLYDLKGERQFYFDEEVVPWRQESWAEALRERWPHILIEVQGD